MIGILIREHPDIEWAHRTGYGKYNQPIVIRCCECGDEIDGDVYEDEHNVSLCEYCLLRLHKKEW